MKNNTNSTEKEEKNTSRNNMRRKSIEEKLVQYNISKKATIIALLLCIVVDIFGFTLILPLLPSIIEDFGGTPLVYGVVVASNAATSLICGPIWGKLSDKYGRKPILIINQIGTITAFFILAFAGNIELIIFSRMLDGMFGGQLPIVQAIVADVTEVDTRAKDFSKIMVIMMLSTFIGPVIGGILGEINWRYPALLTICLALLSMLLTIFVLKESMPKERRTDLINHRIIMQEGREKLPLKDFFTSKVILRLLQGFALSMLFQFFFSTYALVMNYRYNSTVFEIGLIMAAFSIVNAIFGGPILHILLKKIDSIKLIMIGVGCLIISMIIYAISSEHWMLYLFLVPYIAGVSFTRPIVQTNLTRAVDEDQQGRASGWAISLQSVAQTIIPLSLSGIIEVGYLMIFFVKLDPYVAIGGIGIIITLILISLVIIDKKKFDF
ncbi:MAG: MFS transporter [Promethearchaeota archaeon]